MHKSINIKELWILQRLILRKQKSTFHFSNLLPIWEGKHSSLNRGSFSNPLSFKCRGAKRLEFGGLRFKSPTLLLMSLEKNSASVSLSVQMSSSTAARAACRIVKIKCHIALKQGSLRWNLLVVIYWWWGREYANTSGKGLWLAVSTATEGVMPRLMLEIARWDLIASNTFLVHSSLCNHVSKISSLPEQISMCFLIRETGADIGLPNYVREECSATLSSPSPYPREISLISLVHPSFLGCFAALFNLRLPASKTLI